MNNHVLNPGRLLSEAELLLREGLKRIANTAEENLSGAQNPLEEALRLTEEQTMVTLSAVERAQDAVNDIRSAHNRFIDESLHHIDDALLTILTSQQGQDLAGQRLKKSHHPPAGGRRTYPADPRRNRDAVQPGLRAPSG